jgi:hypothetical protein
MVKKPSFFPLASSPHPEFAAMIRAIETPFARTQGSDGRWVRRLPAAAQVQAATSLVDDTCFVDIAWSVVSCQPCRPPNAAGTVGCPAGEA